MPRKKRTIVEETIPDAPQETIDEFGSLIVLTKVHKLNGADRAFCFQSDTPVDEVTLQNMYPLGGKFIVTEYNSANELVGTPTVMTIEAKPNSVQPVAVNGSADDIRTRMLLEELAFTRNMMLQMINGVFNNKAQTTGTPLGELAQAMQMLHTISPQNNSADLILKGMELGMKANGSGGDWKTALVDTAKDIAPVVVQAFGAARTAQAQQQGQMTMIPVTPAAMLKQGLDWLKPRIISGLEVDLAVGWVIQNANDPMCQQLLSHAAQGLEAFVSVDPEIANEPYKTWFTTAIVNLRQWYATQSANQDDNERGNGDDTDTTVDAPISVGKSTIAKVS